MKRTNAAILSVLALMGTAGLLAFTGLHEKAIRQAREYVDFKPLHICNVRLFICVSVLTCEHFNYSETG